MRKRRDGIREVYKRIKMAEPIGWWRKTIDIPAKTTFFSPPSEVYKDYQGKQPNSDYNPFQIHEVHGLDKAKFIVGADPYKNDIDFSE